MSQYRIITATYYYGCIPVTVNVVQKRVRSFLWHRWININAFEDKNRAIDFLNFLKGGKQ